MTAETPVRSLHQVERGIEEALRDFAGGVNGSELPEITAAERIDKIGNMSALAIVQASELTAKTSRKRRKPPCRSRRRSCRRPSSSPPSCGRTAKG